MSETKLHLLPYLKNLTRSAWGSVVNGTAVGHIFSALVPHSRGRNVDILRGHINRKNMRYRIKCLLSDLS
jgi:hypothetical protein